MLVRGLLCVMLSRAYFSSGFIWPTGRVFILHLGSCTAVTDRKWPGSSNFVVEEYFELLLVLLAQFACEAGDNSVSDVNCAKSTI